MEISERYQKLILELIRSHLGKDNPIMVSEIMKKIPLTDREIRKVVQLLVNESRQPIGSTTRGPHGFFLIVSFEDYLEAVKNLFNRKDKLQERIEALREACKKAGLEVPKVEIHNSKKGTVFNISNSVVIYFK